MYYLDSNLIALDKVVMWGYSGKIIRVLYLPLYLKDLLQLSKSTNPSYLFLLTGKSSEFLHQQTSISSFKSSTDVNGSFSRNISFEIYLCVPGGVIPTPWPFYIVKQRFELNFSIFNQLMECIQVGMVMHVSVSVSGMDLLPSIQVQLVERKS